jgi:hypothetical protein
MTVTSLFLLASPIQKVPTPNVVFPLEVLPEMASSVEGTRFDRGHCQAEASSSFRIRELLQFAKQSDGPQVFSKSRNGISHSSTIFIFG